MSVRRDNRSVGGMVTPGGPHAKLTHDRHNHELLKRLATHATHAPRKQPPPAHATPGKGPPVEGVASPGGRAGPREGGRGRGEAGPSKSLLRPTSSSALKAAGGAAHSARRLDSNKRPRPPARKAGAGDAPARRSPGRAPPPDKEEKDSLEDKLRQDSLPETPDKDRRDAPTPPPPDPAAPPDSSPVTAAAATNEAPAETPAHPIPSPTSPPAPAPSPPTPGLRPRQQDTAQAGGKACVRPAAGRGGGAGLESAPPPSREEVLRGVRARVGGAAQRGGVDVDRDVCEAAADEEEEEFFRVRVRTRLVTYDNNTLIIRNTSRGGAAPPEATQDPHPDPRSEATLQEPLPEADAHHYSPAEPHHDPSQTDPDPHGQPTPTPPAPAPAPQPVSPSAVADSPTSKEEAPHAHAHAVTPAAPPSQAGAAAGVKRRLTLLVNRGRSFLAEVYSATQSRLEHYVRQGQEAPRPHPRRSHALPPPLLVEVNPLWVAQHLPQAQWVPVDGGDLAGVPLAAPYTAVPDGATGRRRKKKKKKEEEVEEEAGGDVTVGGGVGVQVDEEWIKKNILCTCKCRHAGAAGGEEKVAEEDARPREEHKQGAGRQEGGRAKEKEEVGSSEGVKEEEDVGSSEGVKEEEERKEAEHDITVDAGKTKIKEEEEDRDEERVTEEKEEEEEALCYCSCHEGEGGASLPYLPTQVQELLDADHARMWWTITGNFGNILPIDWSKTYTRQQYLPVLNLNEMKEGSRGGAEEGEGEKNAEEGEEREEEEEEVAQDLDLHHLILNGLSSEPVKSAEEVIQEIDDIMQEGSSSEDEGVEESTSSGENMQDPPPRPCPPHLYHDKLKNMSVPELNEALMELELVIRQYSETLITQLALRDELEYEKELKNSFISLLLQVQNKRRNYNVEKKKQKKVGPNGIDPKYLTTVIPYDVGHGPPHNPTLQILIKILTAINEDSPTVPTLLTDYILKVLCPS